MNVFIKNKCLKNNRQYLKSQQGFVVLLAMLALVLGAAVWFGGVNNIRSESIVIAQQNENTRELQRIKERMLAYAVFQPEIFGTDSGSTVKRSQEEIPGPGYFPCPDTDGNGNSNAPCGGGGVTFVSGLIPESISSRSFTFIDRHQKIGQYWFAVDARFLTQNSDYYYDSTNRRFVPLNRNSPTTASLTLDGRTDIVMVLIYSGAPVKGRSQSSPNLANISNFLELDNADGDADFISYYADPNPVGNDPLFNDYVISITRTEWNAAMLSRVSKDLMTGTAIGSAPDNVPDLCSSVSATDLHWFNDCLYVGNIPPFTCTDNTVNGSQNLYGQGWRTELGCP